MSTSTSELRLFSRFSIAQKFVKLGLGAIGKSLKSAVVKYPIKISGGNENEEGVTVLRLFSPSRPSKLSFPPISGYSKAVIDSTPLKFMRLGFYYSKVINFGKVF